MAPIVKDKETAVTGTEAVRPVSAVKPAGDAGGKTQAVALEVPVSVNGARTVEGSDKREPFSETTNTVLVFGSGAVIRLQSPVAPGQLLFLTNEKTKKEVVCQVVKSKNYRNVSGYVELEFTEPVTGFWGMRFPNDRVGQQPGTTGEAAAPPVARPTIATPTAPTPPRPDATANFNALKAMVSSPADTDLPRSTAANVVPPAAKPASVESDPATEALKLQTARLQEQLSAMRFNEKPAQGRQEASSGNTDVHHTSANIFEEAKPEAAKAVLPEPISFPEPAAPSSVESSTKPSPTAGFNQSKSTLEEDEVKIPSWLEPLARNVAPAPGPAEPRPKEEPKPHREEPILVSDFTPEPLARSGPSEHEAAGTPVFGARFLETGISSTAGAARSSNKGIVIGALAAGLLVVAAGIAWYVRNQQGAETQTSAPSAIASTTAAAPSAAQSLPVNTAQNSGTPLVKSSTNPEPKPAAPVTVPVANPSKSSGTAAASTSVNNAVVKTPVSGKPTQAIVPAQTQTEPKRAALGQVRLAAPKLRGNGGQKGSGSPDEPGFALNNAAPNSGEVLGAGLATNSNQPAAPMEPRPVGGEVKPAKLLSSVSPAYPQLAKSQHVAGDVRIDALIDENGRVTTMKVISGPTLLHQSAMDALRQWKYAPAMLDGKAVPMHLTVTLQFRLQ